MKKLLLCIATSVSFSLIAMHIPFNTKSPSNPTSPQNDRFYFDVKNDTEKEITVYCHKYKSQNTEEALPIESYNIKAGYSAKFMIYSAIQHFVLSKNETRPSLSEFTTKAFSYDKDSPMSNSLRTNNNALFETNFSMDLEMIPVLCASKIFDK